MKFTNQREFFFISTASVFLISCTVNPLSPGGSLPPGFHPGIPITSSSDTSPSITGVLPSSGPTIGGTSLTIRGTGFANGVIVFLGAQSCLNLHFVSSTEITCVTAAHSAGANPVVVANPDELNATLDGGFFYTAPGTSTPTFGLAVGGGFSSGAGIKLRGTAGVLDGGSILQSGGSIRAYTGIQSIFKRP